MAASTRIRAYRRPEFKDDGRIVEGGLRPVPAVSIREYRCARCRKPILRGQSHFVDPGLGTAGTGGRVHPACITVQEAA